MRETAETISSHQSHSREKDNGGGLNMSSLRLILYHFIDVAIFLVYFDNRKLPGCEMSCVVLPGLAGDDICPLA